MPGQYDSDFMDAVVGVAAPGEKTSTTFWKPCCGTPTATPPAKYIRPSATAAPMLSRATDSFIGATDHCWVAESKTSTDAVVFFAVPLMRPPAM
jgi:hypothetical protein